MKGQIVRVIAGFYDIKTDDKEEYRVRGSGKLRILGAAPCVGDFVEFNPDGFIEKIYERRNELIRPKVANVDQVVVVTSLDEPKYSSFLLNKLLSVVEFNDIKTILIFTKKDLSNEQPHLEFKKMGYEVYVIDNNNKNGIEQLSKIFTNKLSVFTGQTGVGKSSTIANVTSIDLKTQAISKALGRGKHTTRIVEILSWNNGSLIDTPGFSSFEVNLNPQQLSQSYEIFKKYFAKCKFNNCLHFKEKNCEIKRQVENGNISQSRYDDYIRLVKEALNE